MNQLPELDRLLASYFGPLKDSVEANKVDLSQLPPPQVTVPEIKLPTITVPDIKVPEVVIPEIKLPPIHVPKPEVTVNVDEVNIKNWPEYPKFDTADIIKELKKLQNKTSGGGGSSSTMFYNGSSYVDVSSTNKLPVTGPVNIIDASGNDMVLDVGGTTGIKTHIVGMLDVYAEGTVAVGASLSGHFPLAIGYKDGSGLNQFVSATTALPVTGTLDLGATDNAVLDAIAASLATLDNIVAGNEAQVDVLTMPAITGSVGLTPATSGGLTIFRSIDLDETEEEVKATAGQLYGWYLFNAHTATLYVKLYNATAINTTVGTTTPIMTIPVPAGSAANVEFTNGIAFATALSAACTTGVADADTGAPAANVLIANFLYK